MLLSERFDEAFLFAHRLHARQYRKGSRIPYIGHLMAVSALVIDYGGDENQAIAALLHDAVEDQGGQATREQIRRRFGQTVARIVDDCTDTDQTPKPPWRTRKEQFLERLTQHVADESLLVIAADKLHNARTIVATLRVEGAATFDRFTGKQDGTLWYYREVAERLEQRRAGPIVAELQAVVRQMHAMVDSAPCG